MRGLAALITAAAVMMGWSAAEAATADIEGFPFVCETSDGKRLKPKFGDVDGVFYTDLPAQREQCLETIQRKIAACRDNTTFMTNTEQRKYAACLPIFEELAQACVAHFRHEGLKCEVGGEPKADEAAGREQQPEDDYTVDPADRRMEVAKRANVRAGPGTEYDVVGTLDAGTGVQVTGKVRGRDWLRVDVLEGGGDAFIYASLLKEAAAQACVLEYAGDLLDWSGPCADGKASGQGRAEGDGSAFYEGAALAGRPHGQGTADDGRGTRYEGAWRNGVPHGHGTHVKDGKRYEGEFRDGEPVQPCQYLHDPDPGEWTGSCVDGLASGEGRAEGPGWFFEGTARAGKGHGFGVHVHDGGGRYEGEFRDGEYHGYGTYTGADGYSYEGELRDGKRHGHGIETLASGNRYEGEYRDNKPHGWGTYTRTDGERYEGNWSNGCFGERGGRWAFFGTSAAACGFE